jgi:hypothetical protein
MPGACNRKAASAGVPLPFPVALRSPGSKIGAMAELAPVPVPAADRGRLRKTFRDRCLIPKLLVHPISRADLFALTNNVHVVQRVAKAASEAHSNPENTSTFNEVVCCTCAFAESQSSHLAPTLPCRATAPQESIQHSATALRRSAPVSPCCQNSNLRTLLTAFVPACGKSLAAAEQSIGHAPMNSLVSQSRFPLIAPAWLRYHQMKSLYLLNAGAIEQPDSMGGRSEGSQGGRRGKSQPSTYSEGRTKRLQHLSLQEDL